MIDQCVEVKYNYYISSLEKDWRITNIAKELINILPKENDCEISTLPTKLPDESFDLAYNLPFRLDESEEIIDILVTEGDRRLFKLMLYSYDNPNNNLMGYLYKNLTLTD